MFYPNPVRAGTDAITNFGDGETINVKWYQAYRTIKTNEIAYHIYYSTIKENVYSEGVKFISIDNALEANIIGLSPGQDYWFAVRPVEYDPNNFNLNLLPIAHDNLRIYPSSVLRQDISENDLIIPLLDISSFPLNLGVIKIGVELIQYSVADQFNNNLILTSIDQRGIYSSHIRPHNINGYDGVSIKDPTIYLFTEEESNVFDRIFACQCRFEYPNYAFTLIDGYHQVTKDLLSTDLSVADASNIGFPIYDYSGYHRTDPVELLNGTCVGSYIGGEAGCIDKYGNVNITRGFNLQDQNTQRQEIELSITGRPAVLIKRVQTGITCPCYLASSEYQDDRCPFCLGSKYLLGFEQYFNPRRSDGRIMVRPGPTDENLKMQEAGLESDFPLSLWTLTVPTIKTRDIIILFDLANQEEFRYEVASVTRNNTILGQQGGQLFKVFRVRKFDAAYQIRVFRDTSMFPTQGSTTIGMAIPGVPPHLHTFQKNETDSSNWSQITSISQGHSHSLIIIGGVLTVMSTLNHTHNIII